LLKKWGIFLLIIILAFQLLAAGVGAVPETDPPVTSINIVGHKGTNGIYYGDVSVTLSGSDVSGISSTQYSLDNGTTWSNYTQPFTLVPGKLYRITYRSVDTNNNTEQSKTTVITVKEDEIPPESSITINGSLHESGYYNTTVQLGISANDDHAGVDYSEYSSDNGQTWQTYQEPVTFEDSSNNVVLYRSIDNEGNVEKAKKAKINIDVVPPVLPLIVVEPGEWTNGQVSVDVIDGEDLHSGTQKSQYRLGETDAWLDFSDSVGLDLPAQQTFYARSIDFAGNISEVAEYSLKIDKVAPTSPEITLTYDDWTNEPVGVQISGGVDSESYINNYQYKLNEGGEWTDYYVPFEVNEEGQSTIFTRSVDNAGNISEPSSGVIKIDTTPPHVPSIALSSSQWTNNNVTVQISPGSDALSGPKNAHYRIGHTGEWIEYTTALLIEDEGTTAIYARTEDNAGNVSPAVMSVVKIDKSPPPSPVVTLQRAGLPWTKATFSTHFIQNQAKVIVDVEPDDSSGIKMIQYKVGSSGQWTYYSGAAVIGTNDVFARAIDNAGNISNVYRITIEELKVRHNSTWVFVEGLDAGNVNINIGNINNVIEEILGVNIYDNGNGGELLTVHYSYRNHINQLITANSQISLVGYTYASARWDNEAPSVPTNLKLMGKTTDSVSFSWEQSTDNVNVDHYNIYNKGTFLGSTGSTSFTANGLQQNSYYKFTVKAVDAVGHLSNSSMALQVNMIPDFEPPSAPNGLVVRHIQRNMQN